MAIIYSYPTVVPTKTDLILGTDVSTTNKSTKNFTVQSIIDLVTVATGDLQTVLDLGNIAIGKDIVLGTIAVPSNTMHAGVFTTGPGLIIISNNTATGFANVTSTLFTGTIATPAQPNITSLGTLTSLKIGNATPAVTSIETVFTNPGTDLALATTKAIVDYIATKPNPETLAETLANGNLTGGTDIAVSAGDDITFTDTSKILMGASNDLEIFHDNSHSYIKDTGTGDLTICGSTIVLNNAADNANMITATEGSLVRLFHDGSPKLVTAAIGVSVTGGVAATGSGTFVNLLNSGTYQDSSGDVGTSGQILSSTGTGTNWVTEVPLYNWQFESTAIPSGTDITITDGNNITTTWDAGTYALTIAASGDGVTGSGAVGQVAFWTGTQTESGNGQFLYDATNARARIISNAVAGSGVMGAVTFTTELTTFPTPSSSPQWVGSTMTNMTSITSTSFVGALTGNATTATSLAATGTMSVAGDVSTVGTPPTYTSGGDKVISTTIADTVVTGKVLTNLPTPTSSGILNTDTILAAMAKLQGQITATSGLTYEGLWNATTDSPALSGTTPANGVFYIVDVAGNTSLSGITDWLVGDWAIYVSNGSATDGWQKLDMTSDITGTGSANSYAMWTGPNSVATGLISQNAGANLVTIGNSGGLLVEGDTTLGNSVTDTVTATGPVTLNKNLILEKGLALDSTTTVPYGVAGDVLTSGGGVGAANTWTTPTVGTVTSVGLTETGDALTITNSPITSTGNINIAGAGSASQYINGALDLVTFPTVDNYVSWTADSDEGTDITVTSGFNLKFAGAVTAGGAGIATDSAVSANVMTIGLINAGGTPGATTFYRGDGQWVVPPGTGVAGSGNQYDLAMFSNATGTEIGDSIISQDSAATIASVTGILDVSGSIRVGPDNIKINAQSNNIYFSSRTSNPGTDDQYNVSFGKDALVSLANTSGTPGNANVALGYKALEDLTTGYYNVAIGAEAAKQFTAAQSCVAIGWHALDAATGNNNSHSVAIGASALGSLNDPSSNAGIYNIAIGSGAASNKSSGKYNVFIGGNAAYNKASGDENIYIGSNVAPGAAVESGVTTIGYGIASNGSNTITLGHGSATVFYGGQNGINIGSAAKPWGDLYVDNGFFDGDLTVDGNIIHGGKGGTFTGSSALTDGVQGNLFTLTRANTGTLVFDVWLTSGDNTTESICKRYTVARSYGVVSPPYNKLIDTGPVSSNDFAVSFVGDATTGVICKVTPSGTNQTISYTVVVGYDSVNTLTVS
mgnify:CR=1 FL=1